MTNGKRTLCFILVLSVIAGSTLAVLVYPAMSSVWDPDLYMSLFEPAGGFDAVISNVTNAVLGSLPISKDFALALASAIGKTITPQLVREHLGRAARGIRAFLLSPDVGLHVDLELRGVKKSLLTELRRTYAGTTDYVEILLDEIPDRANLGEYLSVPVISLARNAYKEAFQLVELALAVAGIAALTALLAFRRKGAAMVGFSLVTAAAGAVLASFFLTGPLSQRLLAALGTVDLSLPKEVTLADVTRLVNGATSFAALSVRKASAILALGGAGLASVAFLPRWPLWTQRSKARP